MSKRHNPGDVVLCEQGSGFVNTGVPIKAQIQNQGSEPCFLCEDIDCKEWATLWSIPDADGCSMMLCHVSECQMEDIP